MSTSTPASTPASPTDSTTDSRSTASSSTSTVPDRVHGYSAVSRILHWLVAGGIVLQFMLGERAEEAAANGDLPAQLAALAQHKSIGITVLGCALLRLVWRLLQPPTPNPDLTPVNSAARTRNRLATLMHSALYALLLFLPLSGWLMSSASGYSVAWFNAVQLPDLIGPDERSKALLQTLHTGASKLLLVLAIGHILAALKHWLIDKDAVMSRMGGPLGTLLLIGTLGVGIAYTWPNAKAEPATEAQPPQVVLSEATPVATPEAPPETPTTLPTPAASVATTTQPPLWNLNSTDSHIRFTAEQAGAAFTGEWQRFEAMIRFDPSDLANSSAQVSIDADSLETNDEERDGILAGLDWFDTGNHPRIVFSADEFEQSGDGFATAATLAIRGTSYPISFNFTVTSAGDSHTLMGTARLDRLALKLGTIEWLDTEWVGQFVEVQVHVQAETGR